MNTTTHTPPANDNPVVNSPAVSNPVVHSPAANTADHPTPNTTGHPVEQLSGTIERILFHNAENGYTVFVVNIRAKTTTVAVGEIPQLNPGQQVTLTGSWGTHQKYGRQFMVTGYTQHIPTSVEGLKRYLGSGAIKGIGKAYAERLVERFGLETITVIEEQPERLREVPGIGTARAEKIVAAWQEQQEIARIMVFLQGKGVSTAHATRLYKQYRDKTLAVLEKNPYQIIEDVWGIGFKTADTIAQKLGFKPHDPGRVTAGICHVLSLATGQGNLYVTRDTAITQAAELLGITDHALIHQALYQLYEAQRIIAIDPTSHQEVSPDASIDASKTYIGLAQHYYTELGTARRIQNLLATPSRLTIDTTKVYHALRTQDGPVALNEDQQRGLINALTHKISIITGGPGTGKTTLIRALIKTLQQEQISFLLAAPTGRAAKRMMESTGNFAVTIHRLLEFDPHKRGFTRNETNALKTAFLIVDEASMIDTFLINALIRAIPHDAHLLLLGDIDQLPSVGPGNILHDLIASNVICTTRLTHIFRQAQNSMIVVNAHRINQGEFPVSAPTESLKDFFYIAENDPALFGAHLKRLFAGALARVHIAPHEVAILVPMHRGAVGSQAINQLMQQLVNPQPTASLTVYGTPYKVGDKVMQIRNNYDKQVFNGDSGTIHSIDETEKSCVVDFDGTLVPYESTELHELVLAYAITIHKSQGSEYKAVIIPIFMQHFMLLQRNLLYTAVTRAKKLCILIGEKRAIAMAIKKTQGQQRLTLLKHLLSPSAPTRDGHINDVTI